MSRPACLAAWLGPHPGLFTNDATHTHTHPRLMADSNPSVCLSVWAAVCCPTLLQASGSSPFFLLLLVFLSPHVVITCFRTLSRHSMRNRPVEMYSAVDPSGHMASSSSSSSSHSLTHISLTLRVNSLIAINSIR